MGRGLSPRKERITAFVFVPTIPKGGDAWTLKSALRPGSRAGFSFVSSFPQTVQCLLRAVPTRKECRDEP